jgi:hypothetical protein
MRARPDDTYDQVRSADNQRDDDQFTYRHLKRQQSSQCGEHADYVNGHSSEGEHFLRIFQPK